MKQDPSALCRSPYACAPIEARRLGIKQLSDSKERIYHEACEGHAARESLLFMCSGASYYAAPEQHDSALLEWRNWKNRPHG